MEIKASTAAEAWPAILSRFADQPAGHPAPWQEVQTEDGQLTREIRNLCVTVERPLEGWPIPNSGWLLPALNDYVTKEILSPYPPDGFRYTYGQRLFGWQQYVSQIQYIIEKLKAEPNSRRGIATTWMPPSDAHESSVPCLILVDYLLRDGELHCTAIFRSNDVYAAWPQNVYGLAKLMEHIAQAVGAEVGSLTTHSVSAHVYQL